MTLFLKKLWQMFCEYSKKILFASFLAVLQLMPMATFAFSAYSSEALEELEKEFVQLINRSDTVERDPLAFQYINHIGKKLASSSKISLPYFFIVKSLEINAFAGPGGYIGINSQLILATETESELAAVMAHEIAHVRLHHLYNMLEHQKQMRIPMLASILASLALGAINPVLGGSAMVASLSGLAQDNINFVRSNEKEADRIGIDMLNKAGFDPKGMAGFFKKMQEHSRYYFTDNLPAILRTHPLDEDRIAEAENRSAQMPFKKRSTNSSDYYLFKELIRNNVSEDDRARLVFYQKQCRSKQPDYACQYGQVLTFLNLRQYPKAETLLSTLVQQEPENLYYQITLAKTETALEKHAKALARLSDLYTNYPDNYASLMAYAQGLLAAGKFEEASALLLKGTRQYPRDLALCRSLARAQASDGKKAYAYFNLSQCLLLEGRGRDAMRQLAVAKKMAQKDSYLKERISAKMDEIKFLSQ